jgi:hypothetical protein
MTALGDVSSMFIVIEYNNLTYPETTTIVDGGFKIR